MSESRKPLLDLKSVGLIVVLSGLFQVYMTWVLTDFIPTESTLWQWVWACYAAVPLTGTFFLAAAMFTMVLVDQLRRKKAPVQ